VCESPGDTALDVPAFFTSNCSSKFKTSSRDHDGSKCSTPLVHRHRHRHRHTHTGTHTQLIIFLFFNSKTPVTSSRLHSASRSRCPSAALAVLPLHAFLLSSLHAEPGQRGLAGPWAADAAPRRSCQPPRGDRGDPSACHDDDAF